MFNPVKKEYFNKTARMPNDLIQRLEAVADLKGLSFNQIVVQCCEYALDHLEESEKERISQIEREKKNF